MKLLILGIDGGDARIIDAMDLPYLKSLLARSIRFAPKEDLFGRGWAKILSGRPGDETGAFYTKPEALKQGCVAVQSFRSTDYERVGAEPLWRSLNRQGFRVGFMNIPTTFPAPEVDGFFVAGAGGGLGSAGGVAQDAAFPNAVRDVLEQEKYIFDTRYMASGIRDRAAFLKRLRAMTERRVAAFQRLSSEYAPDVGFLAFVGPQRVQYLAMQEIEAVIEAGSKSASLSHEQKEIVDFYRHFDAQLQCLLESIEPDNVMIVSDHGQAPYRHAADPGVLLETNGWQVASPKRKLAQAQRAKGIAKALLPQSWKKRLASNRAVKNALATQGALDFQRSKAFAMRYVPGIYVNDGRFNGPVVSKEQSTQIQDAIIEAFNADESAREHGLRARRYRSQFPEETPYRHLLPDIWIDAPDTVFFEHGVGGLQKSAGRLIAANPAYGKPIDWVAITRDQWTGIKGRYPLLAISSATQTDYTSTDGLENDLTDAYRLALRICQG